MNSFLTRTISALAALGVLVGLYHFLSILGLKILVSIAVLIGTWELNKVLFKETTSVLNKFVFFTFSVLIFILSSWKPIYSGLFYSFLFVFFCIYSISSNKKFNDVVYLALYQSKAALGFFYMGLLPSFVQHILSMHNGLFWFLSLLGVVFAGDIGAYLVGMQFGKRKVMPIISPKKTLEGAVGGLIFSLTTGLLCSHWFPQINPFTFGALSLVAGIAAQFGDFFESLLKRVADVKDSGNLMPGHGGVLDRIDGVLFASPVFLLGAILLEKLI